MVHPQTGASQGLGGRQDVPLIIRFTFPRQHRRQVGKRRQIPRCAHRSQHWNHRDHPLIEKTAQGLQQLRQHGRIALGQTHQAGKDDGARLLDGKHLPQSAAVLTDDLVSKLLEVCRIEGMFRVVAHTGGDAIDGMPRAKGSFQNSSALLQLCRPGRD